MEMIVKCNCRNHCRIEGYVKSVKFVNEEINGKMKQSLEFTVQSINEDSNGEAFITPFPVVCYKQRAISVHEFIKENMLVEVEGRIRITPQGKVIIVAVYVDNSAPSLKKVIIPEEGGK